MPRAKSQKAAAAAVPTEEAEIPGFRNKISRKARRRAGRKFHQPDGVSNAQPSGNKGGAQNVSKSKRKKQSSQSSTAQSNRNRNRQQQSQSQSQSQSHSQSTAHSQHNRHSYKQSNEDRLPQLSNAQRQVLDQLKQEFRTINVKYIAEVIKEMNLSSFDPYHVEMKTHILNALIEKQERDFLVGSDSEDEMASSKPVSTHVDEDLKFTENSGATALIPPKVSSQTYTGDKSDIEATEETRPDTADQSSEEASAAAAAPDKSLSPSVTKEESSQPTKEDSTTANTTEDMSVPTAGGSAASPAAAAVPVRKKRRRGRRKNKEKSASAAMSGSGHGTGAISNSGAPPDIDVSEDLDAEAIDDNSANMRELSCKELLLSELSTFDPSSNLAMSQLMYWKGQLEIVANSGGECSDERANEFYKAFHELHGVEAIMEKVVLCEEARKVDCERELLDILDLCLQGSADYHEWFLSNIVVLIKSVSSCPASKQAEIKLFLSKQVRLLTSAQNVEPSQLQPTVPKASLALPSSVVPRPRSSDDPLLGHLKSLDTGVVSLSEMYSELKAQKVKLQLMRPTSNEVVQSKYKRCQQEMESRLQTVTMRGNELQQKSHYVSQERQKLQQVVNQKLDPLRTQLSSIHSNVTQFESEKSELEKKIGRLTTMLDELSKRESRVSAEMKLIEAEFDPQLTRLTKEHNEHSFSMAAIKKEEECFKTLHTIADESYSRLDQWSSYRMDSQQSDSHSLTQQYANALSNHLSNYAQIKHFLSERLRALHNHIEHTKEQHKKWRPLFGDSSLNETSHEINRLSSDIEYNRLALQRIDDDIHTTLKKTEEVVPNSTFGALIRNLQQRYGGDLNLKPFQSYAQPPPQSQPTQQPPPSMQAPPQPHAHPPIVDTTSAAGGVAGVPPTNAPTRQPMAHKGNVLSPHLTSHPMNGSANAAGVSTASSVSSAAGAAAVSRSRPPMGSAAQTVAGPPVLGRRKMGTTQRHPQSGAPVKGPMKGPVSVSAPVPPNYPQSQAHVYAQPPYRGAVSPTMIQQRMGGGQPPMQPHRAPPFGR